MRLHTMKSAAFFLASVLTAVSVSQAVFAAEPEAATQKQAPETKPETKPAAKPDSKPEAKAKAKATDVSFEDMLVQGKYHFSDEAVTTVEDDKVLDALLGVRTDFKDRMKKSASRH